MIIHFFGDQNVQVQFIRVGKYNDIGILITSGSYISGSIMPGYKWLFDNKPMDVSLTQKKMDHEF
jgi:cytochrome c oxidase cbb3-type subunit I/II